MIVDEIVKSNEMALELDDQGGKTRPLGIPNEKKKING